MNLLRISVLVAGLLIARAQAKDEAPAPLPPVDDSASAICPQSRLSICTNFCANNPNPTCFNSCCFGA